MQSDIGRMIRSGVGYKGDTAPRKERSSIRKNNPTRRGSGWMIASGETANVNKSTIVKVVNKKSGLMSKQVIGVRILPSRAKHKARLTKGRSNTFMNVSKYKGKVSVKPKDVTYRDIFVWYGAHGIASKRKTQSFSGYLGGVRSNKRSKYRIMMAKEFGRFMVFTATKFRRTIKLNGKFS